MQTQSNVMLKMKRLRIIEKLLFILFFNTVFGDKSCDTSDAVQLQCSTTEYCDQQTNKCVCLPGYARVNETHCNYLNSTTPNYSSLVHNDGHGSLVAGIIVPLCLILFVISAIYVSRRYNLLDWIRHRINQRHSNYDEFMIGQDLDDDDPPIH